MKFKTKEAKELVSKFGLSFTHSEKPFFGIGKFNVLICNFKDHEEFYADGSKILINNKINQKLYPKAIQYKIYLIIDNRG